MYLKLLKAKRKLKGQADETHKVESVKEQENAHSLC
jgi:hypothetical protein